MFHVLIACALCGYCIWMCRIDRAASETGSDRRAPGEAKHARLEAADAPQWPGMSWSALDERQLNRLLKESSP